ncbi:MAG: hypothetical protein NTZ23_05340 [Cyanobium sp. LacPavin_0920_WC12_MAG_63_22]|nr:hypothetical protein [Cyanobium sp. LacPavin_0920_WC12_MAG_63_22]
MAELQIGEQPLLDMFVLDCSNSHEYLVGFTKQHLANDFLALGITSK